MTNPIPEREQRALQPGQIVRAFSKRWTPEGWEPVEELATVVNPCVEDDPDYAGDVEIAIEGRLDRIFVPLASLELAFADAPRPSEGVDDIAASIAREKHGSWEAHPTLYGACFEGARAALLSQREREGWREVATAEMWQVAVVTDGENVAIAQKAETDFGGHYWAVDPEDALDWEPKWWMPLPAPPCEIEGDDR